MTQCTRRSFLKRSLFTTASLSLLPAWAADTGSVRRRVLGANDDIRYAVVGFNGRGQDHLKELGGLSGARLVAVCDVDRHVLDRELAACKNRGQQVQGYTDVRRLLDNQDVDVVTFATPNHWHSLGAIWAIQAGKDVYVEKPISHNVWEGYQLVAAARKYNAIVQAGTQCRSNPGMREAIAWVQAGNLGKIRCAYGLCYKRRPSIGKVNGPQPIPPNVDYDLWCGPRDKAPLRRKHLHYDWHWVWPTGNGDLGNQGIHQMDIARWVLGQDRLSPRILSLGGRLGYSDDGTTPNTLIVLHDYPEAPLIFEVRGLPTSAGSSKMDNYYGASIGVVVTCEGGRLVIPSYDSATAFDKSGAEVKKFKGGASHFANFLEAVRSRDRSHLNAEVHECNLSSALCHTGNISYRLGKPHSPAELKEAAKDRPELADSLGRMEEHLAANMVDLAKTPVTLGAVLEMDPHNPERFLGSRHANALLRDPYRKPFVVPEQV